MADQDLRSFVDSACEQGHLRVQEDLGDGFVRLRTDEAERRQAAHDIRSSEDIVIELLRNSRDASAHVIFLATSKSSEERNLIVIDDGCGIPVHLHESVFEPRVTSKLDTMHMDKWGVHGRGMALYSIKVNAQEAAVLCSAPEKGTALAVRTNTSQLPERTDQSTFPQLLFNESGKVAIKGPKNIIRTVCEFALAHRDSMTVYVGSPAEIAATLYAFAMASSASSRLIFQCNPEDLSAVKLLASASDAEEFSDLAHQLGLNLSTRTAYRILDGSIPPLDSVMEQMEKNGVMGTPPSARESKKKDKRSGVKGVKIDSTDMEVFKEGLMKAFQSLAEGYYLDDNVDAQIRVDGGTLRVSIPLVDAQDAL